MFIAHLAIWAKDLEMLKHFYTTYFRCTSSEVYVNPIKNFKSYFLCFNGGCKIELMTKPGLLDNKTEEPAYGMAHFAVCVGTREHVDRLTNNLHDEGFIVSGWPRITGDGYYESVIEDPEGNLVELVAEI